MKSCIEWRKGFKYLPEIDQFNIDFRNKEIQLTRFLELYAKSQRVNIRLPEDYTQDNIELLEAAYDKNYNIAIILPDIYYVERLKAKGVPFFLGAPARSWDEFAGFLSLGVSDIYVACELGFELDKISDIAKKNNVKIRCYANINQSSWKGEKGLKGFFIRPEDVDFYSNYVDVLEFYDAVDQQNVLYDVYFHSKEWNGKLREIIKSLNVDINNYYILGSEFARRRSQCGKRCLKGSKCQLCERLLELANSLEESPDYQVFKRR